MMDQVRNQREDHKARWHTLLLRATSDVKLADKVLRQMITEEIEARLDAGK